MTDTMQAESVQSRQEGFVRCCLKQEKYMIDALATASDFNKQGFSKLRVSGFSAHCADTVLIPTGIIEISSPCVSPEAAPHCLSI